MPSTRVILSPSTYARLEQVLPTDGEKNFEARDLELSFSANEIAVAFDTRIYEPKLAPPFANFVHFLSFVATPDTWSVRRLPKVMPKGLALHLIDVLEEIIAGLDDLTGHERLEILAALDVAKTAPATIAIRLQPPANLRQTRHRTTGQHLAGEFASDLKDLTRQMARYRQAVAGSYLEAPVAKLSLQGMLVDSLIVGTARSHDNVLLAEIISTSKKRGSPYQTTGKTVAALGAFAGDLMPGNRNGTCPIDWAFVWRLHRQALSNLLPPEKTGHARQTEMRIRRIGGGPDGFGLMPSLIEQAMTNWSDDFALERWLDLPWLIRLTLTHLEFQRIHPFSDGNGRIGRLIMLMQLIEQGCPAIPLDLAIYRRRDAYLTAIGDAIAREEPEIFLRFLIEACQEAVHIGRSLIKALRPRRLELMRVLRSNGYPPADLSDDVAHVLGGLLHTSHRIHSLFLPHSERHLSCLAEKGLLEPLSIDGDIVWRVPGLHELIRDFLDHPPLR